MKKFIPLYLLAGVGTAIAAESNPAADSQAFTDRYLEEIVVSASRMPMPLRQVGSSVSVLTADDIRARGFVSIPDVLRNQTAIGVSNAGGQGKQTALRIRGEEGYRTLVIIDGVEVSDPTGTQVSPQLQHVLSSDIARIEILRGPQGMMYGADAGGVVNITSNTVKDGVNGGVTIEAGRYDSRLINGYVGAGNAHGDVYLSLSDFQTDGFNALKTDTVLADKDGYDNQTAHLKAGLNLNDHWRAETVLRKTEADSAYDSSFGSNDLRTDYEQTIERFALLYTDATFTHTLAYNITDIERTNFTDGVESYFNNGEREKVEYLGSVKLQDNMALVFGIENEKEQSFGTYNGDSEREQLGYFVEAQSQLLDDIYFTAGVRQDDNDDFGKHTSYRVTAAYVQDLKNGDAIKYKTSYGTGFRAPSLYESAYNYTPWVFAPALNTTPSEETSKGYDAGIEYIGAQGLHAELVYFDQRINDEIIYDFVSGGYLQASGESRSTGVEVSFDMPIKDVLFFYTNYTYNDSDTNTGEDRVRRPVHQGNIGLTYYLVPDKLSISSNWHFVRDVIDVGNVTLDDYETLDIRALYHVTNATEVFVRVENATDENYQEVSNYNVAGAAAYAGVRFSF